MIKHQIKVKDKDPIDFDIKFTHRGPLVSSKVIKNAQVLFGNQIPLSEDAGTFSLAWAGHIPGESILGALDLMS